MNIQLRNSAWLVLSTEVCLWTHYLLVLLNKDLKNPKVFNHLLQDVWNLPQGQALIALFDNSYPDKCWQVLQRSHFYLVKRKISEITEFSLVQFQPDSGAQFRTAERSKQGMMPEWLHMWKLGIAKAAAQQRQSWTCTLWCLRRTPYSKANTCKGMGYHKIKIVSFQPNMCKAACRWFRKCIR